MKQVGVLILVILICFLTIGNYKKSKEIKKLNKEVQELSKTHNTNVPNRYLGKFSITHYCSCPKCTGTPKGSKTASGTTPKENRTIAVDKNKIPLGSIVYIEDVGVFIAEDTGGDIKENRIDIYVEDHDKAIKLGTLNGSKKKVFIIK